MKTETIFYNADGEYAELEFFVQDKPAEKEDFFKLLDGENGKRIKQFVKDVYSHKIFEIHSLNICKGRSYQPHYCGLISTFFGTYMITAGETSSGKCVIKVGREHISISNVTPVAIL